jgi:hypothetical protein
MRPTLLAWLVAAACACLAPPVLAQQPTRGSIDGVVVDDSTGERRPAVTVTIAGTQRGALTDEQGRFIIGDLAAGTYTLRTRALSYRQTETLVTVRAGSATTVTLRIASAPVTLGAVRARACAAYSCRPRDRRW